NIGVKFTKHLYSILGEVYSAEVDRSVPGSCVEYFIVLSHLIENDDAFPSVARSCPQEYLVEMASRQFSLLESHKLREINRLSDPDDALIGLLSNLRVLCMRIPEVKRLSLPQSPEH